MTLSLKDPVAVTMAILHLTADLVVRSPASHWLAGRLAGLVLGALCCCWIQTPGRAPSGENQERDSVGRRANSAVPTKSSTAVVSRSARPDVGKAQAPSVAAGAAVSRSEDLSDGDPREIARTVPLDGFSADQSSCLDSRYVSESNWRIDADNPASSASGIRALTQLNDLPADYMTSAESRIRWGLEYIHPGHRRNPLQRMELQGPATAGTQWPQGGSTVRIITQFLSPLGRS